MDIAKFLEKKSARNSAKCQGGYSKIGYVPNGKTFFFRVPGPRMSNIFARLEVNLKETNFFVNLGLCHFFERKVVPKIIKDPRSAGMLRECLEETSGKKLTPCNNFPSTDLQVKYK